MSDPSDLDELDGDQLHANALKDGFILDDWSVNTSPFQKNEMDHEYPWEDVEASRRNRRLQKTHRLPEGIRSHFAEARPCPQCQSPADALSWFYFRSPKETWEQECGVAGWIAVCDRCRVQVNFFIAAMN
jgi:hypothetical protein